MNHRASCTSDEFDFPEPHHVPSAPNAGQQTNVSFATESIETKDVPTVTISLVHEEEVKQKPSVEGNTSSGVEQQTLVIYGLSGYGKSHLVQKLVHSNLSRFSLVISHTTRKRRPINEINGIDFHFISRKEITSQIAQGNFIEYVHISKPKRERSKPDQLATSTRFESIFDLTEDDSHSKDGEIFGTSWQALHEAQLQGKPCIVLNVSTKGAQQLKEAGVKATYVLLYPGARPDPESDIQPDYAISISKFDNAYTELQQYAFKQLGDLSLTPSTQHQMAEDEWRRVPTWEIDPPKMADEIKFPQQPQRQITFNELFVHFQTADLIKQMDLLKAEQHKSGMSHFFTKHRLPKRLCFERNLIFAIALCPLNNQEPIHLQALQTVYKKLTGSSSPGRYGSHWEDIGFHGVDPADNLRGVGCVGLMQLIYFLEMPRTLPLAREIYKYMHSRDQEHSVPFCVLSINMTQLALSALREGCLSRVCNKRDQVFIVVNEFHIAMLYHFYTIWKTEQKTIKEVGPLIQEVGQFARRKVKQLLRGVDDYLACREQVSRSESQLLGRNKENPFTPMDQLQQLADITTVVWRQLVCALIFYIVMFV